MSEEQVSEATQETKAAKEWAGEIKELGDKIVALSLMQAKELADYLRRLNLEFEWKTRNFTLKNRDDKPGPPPRPIERNRISMSMIQERNPRPRPEDLDQENNEPAESDFGPEGGGK